MSIGMHHGSSSGNTPEITSVQVALRVRPITDSDLSRAPALRGLPQEVLHVPRPTTTTSSSLPRVIVTPYQKQFAFDHVFGPDASQKDVFEECIEGLVDKFMDGYNATCLAYGQTSSGKTYSMGTGFYGEDEDTMGIIPRAMRKIFGELSQRDPRLFKYQVKVSYLELYNEDLIDLLSGATTRDAPRLPVTIREDNRGNIIWSGVNEMRANSAEEVLRLLTQGGCLRQTGSTDMNEMSSRSHAIFSVTLRQERFMGKDGSVSGREGMAAIGNASKLMQPRAGTPSSGIRPPSVSGPSGIGRGIRPPSVQGMNALTNGGGKAAPVNLGDGTWQILTSKFHFVDLAGSERLKKTNASGERAKEGISINAGLSALGNVISALGDPSKKAIHVPYRDSKLTRLLQDSLGGNSQTLMLACVSPSASNLTETINTLKYANRARNIKNKTSQNEEMSFDVEELQSQIVRLKTEIRRLKGMSIASDDTDFTQASGGDFAFLRKRTEALEEELEQSHGQYAHLEAQLMRARREIHSLHSELSQRGPRSNSVSQRSNTSQNFVQEVEPIIEDYEKIVSGLENQLSEVRDALAAAEAQLQITSAKLRFEETVRESNAIVIAELKQRIADLQDHEARKSDYIMDLESRIRGDGGERLELETDAQRLRIELAAERAETKRLAEQLALYESADVAGLVDTVTELEDKIRALEQGRAATTLRRTSSQRKLRQAMSPKSEDKALNGAGEVNGSAQEDTHRIEVEVKRLESARAEMEKNYQEREAEFHLKEQTFQREKEGVQKKAAEESAALLARIAALEVELALARSDDTLEQRTAQFEEKIQLLQESETRLRKEAEERHHYAIAKFEADIATMKQQAEQALAAEIAKRDAMVISFDKEIATLQLKVENVEVLRSLRAELVSLHEARAVASGDERKAVEAQIAALQEKIDATQELHQATTALEVEALRAQVTGLQATIAKLKEEAEESEQSKRRMASIIDELNDRLDEMKAISEREEWLRTMLDEKMKHIVGLEKKVAKMESGVVVLRQSAGLRRRNSNAGATNGTSVPSPLSTSVTAGALDEYKELSEAIEALQEQVRELKSGKAELETELEATRAEAAKVTEFLEVKKELARYETLHSQQARSISELQESLQRAQQHVDEKTENVASLEHQLEALQKEYDSAVENVRVAMDAMTEQKAELERLSVYPARVAELETLLEEARGENTSLTESTREFQLQHKSEMERLTNEMKALSSDTVLLKSNLENAQLEHSRFAEERNAQLAAAQKEVESLTQKIRDVEQQLKEKDDQLTEATKSSEGASQMLHEQVLALQSKLSALHEERDEVEKRSQEVIASLEATLKVTESQVVQAHSELKAKVAELERTESALANATHDLEALHERVTAAETRFKAVTSERDTLRDTLGVNISKMTELKEQLASATSRVSELEALRDTHVAKVNDLKSTLESSKRAAEQSLTSFEQKAKDLATKLKAAEESRDALELANTALKSDLEIAQAKTKDVEKHALASADASVKKLEQQIVSLKEECRTLQEANIAALEETRMIEAEMLEVAQINDELERELDSLRARTKPMVVQDPQLVSKLADQEALLAQQSKLIKAHEEKIVDLEAELTSAKESKRGNVPPPLNLHRKRSLSRSIVDLSIPPTPPPRIPPPPTPTRSRSPSPPIPSAPHPHQPLKSTSSVTELKSLARIEQLESDLRGHVALIQTLESTLEETERSEKTAKAMIVQLQLQSDVQKEDNRRLAESLEVLRRKLDESNAQVEAERMKSAQLLEKNRAMERQLTEVQLKKSKLLCF